MKLTTLYTFTTALLFSIHAFGAVKYYDDYEREWRPLEEMPKESIGRRYIQLRSGTVISMEMSTCPKLETKRKQTTSLWKREMIFLNCPSAVTPVRGGVGDLVKVRRQVQNI